MALLFGIFVLCSGGFDWRSKRLGCENRALDARFWYSPEQACVFFNAIGPTGRRIYAMTQVTLDLVFPLTYGTLFALLIVHVYDQSLAGTLVWVPVLAAITDLLENVTTAFLAWQFNDIVVGNDAVEPDNIEVVAGTAHEGVRTITCVVI